MTYESWESMRQRILNPNSVTFSGDILVCERWLNSFPAFLVDMGERPPGTRLERIKKDGGFVPGNCRWATPTEINNNRRYCRRIKFMGKEMTIAQWERKLGFRYGRLWARIVKRGWSVKRALTTP